MSKRCVSLFLALTWFAAGLLLTSCMPAGKSSQATAGHLNLQNWQPEHQPRIPLNGEWLFYSGKLIEPGQPLPQNGVKQKVPASWKIKQTGQAFGQGTYLLKIQLPAKLIHQPLMISTPRIGGFGRFYANGLLMGKNGVRFYSQRHSRSRALSFVSFESKSRELELRILIDNPLFNQGGLYQGIWLASAEVMSNYRDNIRHAYLLAIGFAIFMGINHLMLYYLRRRRMLLYFGTVTLLSGLYIELFMVHGLELLLGDLDFYWNFRSIRALLSLTICLAVAYVSQVFPDESSKRLNQLLWMIQPCLAVLFFFLPAALNHFFFQVLTLEGMFIQVYLAQVLIKARYHHRPGSLVLMLGGLGYLLIISHDILHDNGWITTTYLSPLALILIYFTQSLVLAQFFTRDYERAEQLTHELKESNLLLEARVSERTQNLNEQNQQLHRLMRFKDKVSHMAVHDLKNPLSVILVSLEHPQSSPENLRHYIRLSCQRMLLLIQNLLDVQKIEEAQLNAQIQNLALDAVLSHSLELFKPWSESKQLQIHFELLDRIRIQADPHLLERVLLNLFSNAFKHLPEQGMLTISAQRVSEWACIQICDKGSGISAETLSKLFEAYASQDQSRFMVAGSGLGLTFCKFAIELMQGELSIQSELGQGTLVEIKLPLAKQIPVTSLNPEERERLKPLLVRLKQLKFYQITAIQDVLSDLLLLSDNDRMTQWSQALKSSLDTFDEDSYREIIQSALNSPDSNR